MYLKSRLPGVMPRALAPRRLMAVFGAVLISAVMSQGAQALVIDPAVDAPDLTGTNTGNAQILLDIAGTIGSATELYKQNVGGPEVGSLAGSYETTFANTASDPMDATITYVGGQIVGPTAWLLVKDGNHDPAWYLYNLTALGWDGVDTIYAENFWPNQGAISHVSLFGSGPIDPPPDNPPVSEPATLGLLGSTMVALGFVARRRRG
ncbi:MAG: PEP-CTERM sorting domain-containing protein [Alphaproteobacteria bacterium]|nr:PEP-CTERM sorting domain-containing protein [Alphaproteobacteria bacterium]MCB9930006.1 PEP-CTERM sorting domain-containing protein [Alphaproteobacteria bacterium]